MVRFATWSLKTGDQAYIRLDIICLRDFPEEDESRAYRVIYFARRAEAVYVPARFPEETQATSKPDIDTATSRFAQEM